MYDKNTKKCNTIKKFTDILIIIIAVFISQLISDSYFDGKFIALLICMLIIMFVSTPLKIWIDKKIENHFEIKFDK